MERYEVNKILSDFKQSLDDLENAIDINSLDERLKELENKTQDPNFWSQTNLASSTLKEIKVLNEKKSTLYNLKAHFEDITLLSDEAREQTDIWELLESEINSLKDDLEQFEIKILLNQPYDINDAILEFHPGAGGTESMDWCDMLYRLYTRYITKKEFKYEILDYQPGDEAGIKSVTIKVKGEYAYGLLKCERGVHRLVRISPFDSNKRRHTSFVSLDVIPVFDEVSNVVIKDDDLKIDVYRSSGAGGQSVNTTDSAVRITHLPTQIVVTCQNERSQLKNKETALEILKSKLLLEEMKTKQQQIKNLKGEQKEITWGSQIRSYVFQPYQMVKDHRTNHEVSNLDSVMNGNIDEFIYSYLKETVSDDKN